MKKNLLILDFCETLVKIQTADDFIKFIAKKNLFRYLFLVTIYFLFFTKIITAINYIFNVNIKRKDLITFSLFNLKEHKLIIYGKQYSNNNLIKLSKESIVRKVNDFIDKKNPDLIFIITGGYSYYISSFLENKNIKYDLIISSILNLSDRKKVYGGLKIDCMGNEKVNLLKEKINIFDYNISLFTDDEVSDLPLINISNEVYVVKKEIIKKI